MTNLDAKIKLLNQQYAVSRVTNDDRTYADLAPEAFSDWLQNAERAIRKRMGALDAVVTLLREDADVAVADLRDCFVRLDEIRRLQIQMGDLRAELVSLVDIPEHPEPASFASETETARNVLHFLDAYGDSPAARLVQIVTDHNVRTSIGNSCSRLEALFSPPIQQAWTTLETSFPTVEPVSPGLIIDNMPLFELVVWLNQRATDINRLQEWIRFRETEEALSRLNVLPVLHEVLRREIPLEEATDAFLVRFYRLWLDAVYQGHPVLREFRADDHENLMAAFRQLDRDAIQSAYKRIRTRLLRNPERPHSGLLNAPASSEVGTLMREVGKKRRHLALRQLFRKIPTLLPRIKPCLMMSPLAVSTYLDSPDIKFDLVIFDEASQVRPFDAIGAVYRGRQLLVAGDQKQLPPTNFFDRLVSDDDSEYREDDEEDDSGNLSDFESILDVCCSIGMPRKRLRWHYRSRREPLIAFSNHHFYANELATFPSVYDIDSTTAVSFHFVANGRWRPGSGGGNNPVEARETAELVFKHFEEFPDQSLGVITFNQRQQYAILDELDRLRRERPEVEEFFQRQRDEPLFVKNLENVQGDERDRIIISVAYGFDEHGKFAMRFGPLNVQGGERRLNVAVTRAKHQVVLVSSIHAHDIDLSRTKSAGSRLLRAYLDYAERGVATLGAEIVDDGQREADSTFETEVERALRAEGLDVRRQVGCGGFRIDLALVDLDNPGRYVLGVECDGASYHSSATARDRDRLRQEILEGLGWKICRVWSTDWVRDPNRQVHRIVAAYQDAVHTAQNDDFAFSEIAKSRATQSETPVLRLRADLNDNGAPKYHFTSIDEVPSRVLSSVVLDVLRRYGQTTEEELIRVVARELGFRRVGKRIQERIAKKLADLIRSNTVKRTDGDKLCAS